MMGWNVQGRYVFGTPSIFHRYTGEVVFSGAPLFFADDFVGAGYIAGVPAAGSPSPGFPWVKKIVGAAPPTVALVSNAGGGWMACTLAATSEKEDAALYMNDNLSFDVTKGLTWEARVQISVLPSAAAVQMVWGLQSAWIDGPDNASYYLGFGLLGNGNLIIRSKDGVTTNALPAASVPALNAGDWHIFKIDASDVTNVQFSIDGLGITGLGTIAFAATGANAILQGYAAAYKASGAGVGTLVLDNMKIWSNR